MKRAAQTALCLLAIATCSSNAFAILRPRFPQRTAPPDATEWLIVGDHAKQIGPQVKEPK